MIAAATYRGLRVLDLSTNIAGPYAALILADLGADVIKIERAPHGDDTRALPPRWNDDATVFLAMNRNKRSVLLDLKSDAGRAAVLTLAATADVVIESFPPGVAGKLGLDHQAFAAANPAIISCTVSAFGDGPLGATMPGYDALVQAVSGLMSLTGHPRSEPVRTGPSILDVTTGMWSAIAIQAALARRAAGAGGTRVTSSLMESAFALVAHQIQGLLATGEQPPKLGSGAPSAAPYRVYRASDGFVMIATASEPQFPRLCAALERPALAADDRFATMTARIANREALDEAIGSAVAEKDVATWLTLLGANGISSGRVNDLAEALDLPVARELRLFVEPVAVGNPTGLPMQRIPADPDGAGPRRPPPRLGEHSREVLAEAGLSETEIDALTRR
ncbi:CaiB/BaiF CoA transferase family protein [Sphingomonas echinoides]|uniref:CoA transferase n=1 Tax=Sphingomonas echinoides TaxID=59803 RepID=A0ABU4PLU8_9SPHN|nr:CoA transferase [Sphingomonas echinoides]MDX5985121.1 CoA transferase [Sphingomonas echinoides]